MIAPWSVKAWLYWACSMIAPSGVSSWVLTRSREHATHEECPQYGDEVHQTDALVVQRQKPREDSTRVSQVVVVDKPRLLAMCCVKCRHFIHRYPSPPRN